MLGCAAPFLRRRDNIAGIVKGYLNIYFKAIE